MDCYIFTLGPFHVTEDTDYYSAKKTEAQLQAEKEKKIWQEEDLKTNGEKVRLVGFKYLYAEYVDVDILERKKLQIVILMI